MIKFSLNRWSGQAIANRTWCQCLPLFLATVICFLTLETGAEIRLKPINPPIEKWEKALISYAEKRATGNVGKYVSMIIGSDLLIIDANTGQQLDRVRIGFASYTMVDNGRIFFALADEGIVVYNSGNQTRRVYLLPGLTGQDFTAKIFYVAQLNRLYIVTESHGLHVMRENTDGTFEPFFTLPAGKFSGAPLLSTVIDNGPSAGLLSQSMDGVLYWVGSGEEELKTSSIGGAFYPFPPVVGTDYAYILINGRVLTAITLADQDLKTVWQYDDFPSIATANITVDIDNSQAYIPFGRSVLCLRLFEDKCQEVWRTAQPFRQEIDQPIALYQQGVVLVPTSDIYALDAATGSSNWSCNQRITDLGKNALARWEQAENKLASPVEKESILEGFPLIEDRVSNPLVKMGNVIYGMLSTEKILAFDPANPRFFYWIFEPKTTLAMSPVVAHGYAVVGSTNGDLHIISEDGSQYGKHPLANTAIVAALPSADGTFFIMTRNGEIHKMTVEPDGPGKLALHPTNWNQPLGLFDDIVAPPLFDSKTGQLYIISLNKRMIYTVDGRTKDRGAEVNIGVPIRSVPQLVDDLLIFGTDTGEIKAVKTGSRLQEIWSENVGETVIRGGVSIPVDLDPTRVYMGDSNGTLYAVDVSPNSNISIVWKRNSNNTSIRTTPICDFKAVYLAYSSGKVVALSHSNQLLWEQKEFLTEPLSPIFHDRSDLLIIPYRDGRLIALDRGTGHLLWQYRFDSQMQTDMVSENGILYLLTEEGKLRSLDPSQLNYW